MLARNNFTLTGTLTRDVELKEYSGNSRAKFTIAVDRVKKDMPTNFFTVTAFKGTAQTISKYFKKGSRIQVLGELSHNIWETQSGEKRHSVELIVQAFEFLDRKSDGNGNKKEDFPDFPADDDDENIPF